MPPHARKSWSLTRKLSVTAGVYVLSLGLNLAIAATSVLVFLRPALNDSQNAFLDQQRVEALRTSIRSMGPRSDQSEETMHLLDNILRMDGSELAKSLGEQWTKIRTAATAVRHAPTGSAAKRAAALSDLDIALSEGISVLGLRREARLRAASDVQDRVTLALAINTIIGAALCACGAWLVQRWVTQPVVKLREATQRIAKGDFAVQVRIDGTDEIGRLGEQVNRMAREIVQLREELVGREQRLATGQTLNTLDETLRAPLLEISRLSQASAQRNSNSDEIAGAQKRIITTTGRFEGWLQALKTSLSPASNALQPTDLHKLLPEVLLAVGPLLDQRRLTAEIAQDPSLGLVAIDMLQLEQAIIALVTNAAEASQPGQRIRVTARRSEDAEDMWELEVQDEGSGIPPELEPKVFAPFFSTKRDGNGIGLGLVAAVVERHGGKLLLHSERGKGSRFTMRLPRREA